MTAAHVAIYIVFSNSVIATFDQKPAIQIPTPQPAHFEDLIKGI